MVVARGPIARDTASPAGSLSLGAPDQIVQNQPVDGDDIDAETDLLQDAQVFPHEIARGGHHQNVGQPGLFERAPQRLEIGHHLIDGQGYVVRKVVLHDVAQLLAVRRRKGADAGGDLAARQQEYRAAGANPRSRERQANGLHQRRVIAADLPLVSRRQILLGEASRPQAAAAIHQLRHPDGIGAYLNADRSAEREQSTNSYRASRSRAIVACSELLASPVLTGSGMTLTISLVGEYLPPCSHGQGARDFHSEAVQRASSAWARCSTLGSAVLRRDEIAVGRRQGPVLLRLVEHNDVVRRPAHQGPYRAEGAPRLGPAHGLDDEGR